MGGSWIMVAALPALWAGAVVGLSVRWRTGPHRALVPSAPGGAPPPSRPGPVARLGFAVARAGGRRLAPSSAPWLGAGVILAAGALVIVPVLAPFLVVGAALGGAGARRAEQRRARAAVVRTMPEVVDLFLLAALAGQPVPRALDTVAGRAGGPIADALRAARGRRTLGQPAVEALDALAEAVGDPVRPLVAALISSDRYGTPLVPALERLAAEARLDRRRQAEEAARRLPVTLLFPLVCCTLPAFGLLTIVPLVASALRSLRL